MQGADLQTKKEYKGMQKGAQKRSLLDFYRIQKMIVFIFLKVQ